MFVYPDPEFKHPYSVYPPFILFPCGNLQDLSLPMSDATTSIRSTPSSLDYFIAGVVVSWFVGWWFLLFCIALSFYLHYRVRPRARQTMEILNELIFNHTNNQGVADFVAPRVPVPEGKWEQTERGHIFTQPTN